jgi:glutathione S-transferase
MLTVHKFIGDWGLPDLSPFCIKLETYLRMAGVAYQTTTANPGKAPKQKLPYITDGARTIADSSMIVEHLERTRGEPLDAHLDARQRALATALQALLEEHHYFIIMYVRWCTAAGVAAYRPTMLRYAEAAGIPRALRSFAIYMATRNLRGQAFAQGVARHAHTDIMATGQRHWIAVSELLGDQPFILGERPSTLDATVYAFLVSTIWAPFENEIKTHALAQPNLVAYAERLKAAYWASANATAAV